MSIDATAGYGNTSGGGHFNRFINHIGHAVRMFGQWHQRNLDRNLKAKQMNMLHHERMARTSAEYMKAKSMETSAQGKLKEGEAKLQMAKNDKDRALNEGQAIYNQKTKNDQDYNLANKKLDLEGKKAEYAHEENTTKEKNRHEEDTYKNETQRHQVDNQGEVDKSKVSLDETKEKNRHDEVVNGQPHEWTSHDALEKHEFDTKNDPDNKEKEVREQVPTPTPTTPPEEKKSTQEPEKEKEIPTPTKEEKKSEPPKNSEDKSQSQLIDDLYKKYGKDWEKSDDAWKEYYAWMDKKYKRSHVSLDGTKEPKKEKKVVQANLDETKPNAEKKVVKAKKPTAQVSLDVPDNYDYTSNRAPRMSEITQAGKDLQSQAGANNKGSDQGKINEADWLKATTPDKKELYDLLSKHADLVYKDPDENANAKQAIRNKLDNGTELKDFFGLGRGGRHGIFGSMLPFLYANADKVHDIAQRYGLNLGRIISNSKIAQTRHPKSQSKEKQVENKKPEKEKKTEKQYINLQLDPAIVNELKKRIASGVMTPDQAFEMLKNANETEGIKDDDIRQWMKDNL